MADVFALTVVTPEGEALVANPRFIKLPTATGEIGVLANHSPVLVALVSGECVVDDADVSTYFIPGGFAEISPEAVIITTNYIESSQQTDESRAKSALDRAVNRLASTNGTINTARAENAKKRALARLEIAERS
jgi:F-type H+-transporting ATPase subunit epsilon